MNRAVVEEYWALLECQCLAAAIAVEVSPSDELHRFKPRCGHGPSLAIRLHLKCPAGGVPGFDASSCSVSSFRVARRQ
ncbi:hypothetical protein N7468_003407 [Penicillium chermesinum]|uniref:Uncharacterized protein n=1 Tax=Penicillium chermesinum TaxID=63820 RepID=A0A9W9P6E3_9EURO|nr:uncharacterized protein N7468_003407 [Penicillium chermesinum]KAJ5238788.1 hypothetical protein N7468_003407 [Penicillium chermesinum]